jgi:hypothetical protein
MGRRLLCSTQRKGPGSVSDLNGKCASGLGCSEPRVYATRHGSGPSAPEGCRRGCVVHKIVGEVGISMTRGRIAIQQGATEKHSVLTFPSQVWQALPRAANSRNQAYTPWIVTSYYAGARDYDGSRGPRSAQGDVHNCPSLGLKPPCDSGGIQPILFYMEQFEMCFHGLRAA